jgi:hypothetical protein
MVKLGTGWQPPEDYFSGEEGTYLGTLIRIGVEDKDGNFDPDGTRTFEGTFADEKTGELKSTTVQEWRFQFEDGSFIDKSVAIPYVDRRSGEEIVGERSNYYQYSCALLGKPNLKDTAWTKEDLIGKQALVTVGYDTNDIARVRGLSAVAKAQPAPRTRSNGAPLRQAIAPETAQQPADLPFP